MSKRVRHAACWSHPSIASNVARHIWDKYQVMYTTVAMALQLRFHKVPMGSPVGAGGGLQGQPGRLARKTQGQVEAPEAQILEAYC